MNRKRVLLFLVGATAGAGALTLSAQAVARPEIDRVFTNWTRHDSPGCALGVYQDGRMAYERGYGMASLEHDIPITPETVFHVGSLSKQFTATAAALAIRDGRLSAEDPIRTYLPELPAYADGITVRQLVHHTSRLHDYNRVAGSCVER